MADFGKERRLPDLSKTLQELEGRDWGEPPFESYVVLTSHRVRRKPLGELTVEELRLAIGQQIGLNYLIPIAIQRLKEDPLVEGHIYEGDLLQNVFRVPRGFWDDHPAWRSDLEKIAERFFELAVEMRDEWKEIVLPGIIAEYEQFAGLRPLNKWLRGNGGSKPPRGMWR